MGQATQSAGPSIYGRYETLFRIAAGGMAEVYAARVRGEAGFQKLVALKRMLPHLTDDERFVTMFMDEGKLAANISSPNVVSTMDLGRASDGSLYLVMELVVGTTLSGLLRNAAKSGDSIPVDVGCEMLAQAAQGLHDAHEAKTPFGAPLQLVHRDISPQNILVGIDGRVRITDFGVARAVLRRTKTSTGEFKGKLSYFSPEQCADRDLDRRSDIFSLGVVAWETLTTRRLFHAENPLAVLERVTRMPIPLASTVRTDVPPAVAAIVARALERDRDVRFATALEFATALRNAATEAVGAVDRERISELVHEYGGESLERVQRQLKESLANPLPLHVEIEEFDDPTEISSGIVMRPDEALGSATPRVDTGGAPRFELAPDTATPSKPNQAPLIVAILVALLGLTGGALIGLLASGGAETENAPAATLPSDTVAAETQTDPQTPEQPSVADPDVGGAEDTEPSATAAPATGRRPARARRRRTAGASTIPRRSTEPPPMTEPTSTVEREPEPTPTPEPEVQRPDPRSHTRRVRQRSTSQPAPTPAPPQPTGGFIGWDEN